MVNDAGAGRDDAQTDGCTAVSLLGGGSGTEFLPRVPGAHHHFCSYGSAVAVMANRNGPDSRVDALLGCCRDYSPENLLVSDRRADCPGVHGGLGRPIQLILRPLAFGPRSHGIRHTHPV